MVMIHDFPKLPINDIHWLDVRWCFINGRFNPNHVLEIFTKYSDMETDDLRECVLDLVEQDTKYWMHVSSVVLLMKAIDFKTWLSMMRVTICAVDELMLFILCKIHDRHAMVFTDSKLWSTIEEGHQLSLDELYNISDIHLLYLGQDMYGELKSLHNETRITTISTPASLSKTVVASKTLSNVPSLTKLCQEELKQIGTQNRVQSSCSPLLKPAMENYLMGHLHLMKALGLTKTLPSSQSSNEIDRQPDLYLTTTSSNAEAPMLGQTLPPIVNTKLTHVDKFLSESDINDSDLQAQLPTTVESDSKMSCIPVSQPSNHQSLDIPTTEDDKNGLNVNSRQSSEVSNLDSNMKTDSVSVINGNRMKSDMEMDVMANDTKDVSVDFLVALALQKKVCVNVSVEEADLLCKKSDDKMQREHGLFFEKIGDRILRPRKCTYHITRSRCNSTSGVFYRGQCDDSTPRKRTSENLKRKRKEPSGLFAELIASHRYPQRKRKKPTYTYPVIQDQLKQPTDSDPPPSSDKAVDDDVADTDKPENKCEPIENAKGDESIPKPKGALQTTFYGVKKTWTDKLLKWK